jgi:DNA-binding transcriptional regulator LsrR (DeoR family)
VGIGGVDEDSLFSAEGMISNAENEELAAKGAIGNISGRFYSIDGKPVEGLTGKKMIGVNFDDIVSMKHVIALASGASKVAAIRGALNGKLIKTLFTDVKTAKLIYKNEMDYRKKNDSKGN